MWTNGHKDGEAWFEREVSTMIPGDSKKECIVEDVSDNDIAHAYMEILRLLKDQLKAQEKEMEALRVALTIWNWNVSDQLNIIENKFYKTCDEISANGGKV